MESLGLQPRLRLGFLQPLYPFLLLLGCFSGDGVVIDLNYQVVELSKATFLVCLLLSAVIGLYEEGGSLFCKIAR